MNVEMNYQELKERLCENNEKNIRKFLLSTTYN